MGALTRPPYGVTVPGNHWDLLAHEPAPLTSVSVVVTHCEQPRQLARTLAALGRQTHPGALTEVIVVDDGSAVEPDVPRGVRLLRQEDRGFRAAAARNLGAHHATGRVLVFLDADTTPEPDYLERITRLPSLLPEALVVGRRRHADLSGSGAVLPEPAWLRSGYEQTRDLRCADETSFRFVISAVAACSAWLHDLVGGFDESFPAYGGEDWDWAHRIWHEGGLLAHEPRALAWHDGPDRSGRRGPAERERLLAETLEIARRVEVAGTAPTGLDLGGRDLLVTASPTLGAEQLAIGVDSALAGLPHARVRLTGQQAAVVPALLADARVTVDDRDGTAGFQRLVRLEHAVRADPGTWQRVAALVRGAGAPGLVEVSAPAGPPAAVLTVTALRAHRRAARWDRGDLFAQRQVLEPGLVPIRGEETFQSYAGGW